MFVILGYNGPYLVTDIAHKDIHLLTRWVRLARSLPMDESKLYAQLVSNSGNATRVLAPHLPESGAQTYRFAPPASGLTMMLFFQSSMFLLM